MKTVAIVTCQHKPEPDPDEVLYGPVLAAQGLQSSVVAWEDRTVRWASFDLVLLRSTWNYHHHLVPFLGWLDTTAAQTEVENPAALVRWNAHKGYLLELEAAGIDIVPTQLVRVGQAASLDALRDHFGTTDLVIKPAVSAGSHRTLRASKGNEAEARAHLAALASERDVLVQPYLRAVEGSGERAIVCVEGEPSHSVRKSPRFGGEDESVSPALPVSPELEAFARRVLAAVPGLSRPPLYARVDTLKGDDGGCMLMELELIEPSMFFLQAPHGLNRFAEAVARRLR